MGFKENDERTIAIVQSYRMGNSFPNPAHMDDISLASVDITLLQKKKEFLFSKFKRYILSGMFLVIRIENNRDRRRRGIRNIA